MIFNSLEFLLFLPTVFLLYWWFFGRVLAGRKNQLQLQNLFVVFSSYVFYGWWDWRFLILIAFTSVLSWGSGLLMEKYADKKKIYLVTNILINLLILGLFKYYNFFVGSFCELFGVTNNLALKLILPVGISFYTFQALSYSIDVYRGTLRPTKDAIAFFAYVSFFPQLVAGPIERATNLLPQFEHPRTFNYNEAKEGMQRMLWGFFKKIVVADNCARYVDMEWADYANQNGSTLLLAAVLFAIQIYCDFSGYSDIAIGTARLFGIRLKANFRNPYFSRNVAEFWKRWHISLNTWFVDYVYIPLGGSREGQWKTIRNTFVIFLLSGLWHGANWTYVGWGGYHALLFVPLILLGKTKQYSGAFSWKQMPHVVLTFVLVVFGWIIFRSDSIGEAFDFCRCMLIHMDHGLPWWGSPEQMNRLMAAIVLLFTVEGLDVNAENPLGFERLHLPWWLSAIIYCVIAHLIFYWGRFEYTQFIYFQF